ncbi:MAG: redoxin domain-containing protein [Gemmataceae bacterium]|nr:redoxin domain-containing protein [Gemmataceae bacterium]
MVLGISTDTLALQEKFTQKEKLNFPLYADPEQKVAKTFGVLIPGKPLARRATFVIDKQGTIAKIFPAVKNAGGHPEEVLAYVKANLAAKK